MHINSRKATFFIVGLFYCCHFNSLSEAATRTTLDGQIFGLAKQIKRSLSDNPLVEGHSLQLGTFEAGGEAAASNFGQRIEHLLREELVGVLVEHSRLRLVGNYHFVSSEEPALKNIRILLVAAKIVDDRGRELISWAVEINDTDNIMQALGLTGSAPQSVSASFLERNQSMQSAHSQPSFVVAHQHHVAATGQPTFSVGLQTKPSASGAVTPVVPQNVSGFAYVPVAIGEYYEILLANTDSLDVVATVTVDGLDVANTFSSDLDSGGKRIHWPGYIVPAGKTVVIRGWLNSINPSVKDNLYTFKVDELGKGAATAMRTRGSVGVVTVQFREACAPEARLSGRSFGETARGEGIQEKLTSRPVQIGENVLSTVSVRYNRPEVEK